MARLDPRLRRQTQPLQRLVKPQGGGFRSRVRAGMKGVFGGLNNPRIARSKISPLPSRFGGKRLF